MGNGRLVDLESQLLPDKVAGGEAGIDSCGSLDSEGSRILFQLPSSRPHRVSRRASSMMSCVIRTSPAHQPSEKFIGIMIFSRSVLSSGISS